MVFMQHPGHNSPSTTNVKIAQSEQELQRRLFLLKQLLHAGLLSMGAGMALRAAVQVPLTANVPPELETGNLPERKPIEVTVSGPRTDGDQQSSSSSELSQALPGAQRRRADQEEKTAQDEKYVPQGIEKFLMPFVPYISATGASDPRLSAFGMPAMVAMFGLGGLGGWALADALLLRRRTQLRQQEIEDAKKEYQEALAEVRGEKTAASGRVVDLDTVYDVWHSPSGQIKVGSGDKRKPEPGPVSGVFQALTDMGNFFTGLPLTVGVLGAMIAGPIVYRWAKERRQKEVLRRAMRVRESIRGETAPPVVAAVPATE